MGGKRDPEGKQGRKVDPRGAGRPGAAGNTIRRDPSREKRRAESTSGGDAWAKATAIATSTGGDYPLRRRNRRAIPVTILRTRQSTDVLVTAGQFTTEQNAQTCIDGGAACSEAEIAVIEIHEHRIEDTVALTEWFTDIGCAYEFTGQRHSTVNRKSRYFFFVRT